jgi:hypothetical protein
MDHLNGARSASAGYNRGSFFPATREEPLKGGRDEESGETDAWDVYADFNNDGPRYSSAFGQGKASYAQIPPSSSLLKEEPDQGKVEMVTVPALGAEWGKDELHQATKAGRRERKQETSKQFWKSWNRGERGLCGRYFTRKVLVWSLFALCVVTGIILAVTIPRVPSFALNESTPLVNATGSWAKAVPTQFVPSYANFSFPAFASLQVDTTSNYLPVRFSHLRAQVFDLNTNRQVGSGDYSRLTLPAHRFPEILLPLNFTYVADNSSDTTYQNWYAACKNTKLYADGSRPPLQFRLVIAMDIVGLPTTQSASTQVTDANCPIELPLNAP